MPAGGPVEWRVKGELPGLADHATAYRVVAPNDSAAPRLAAAIAAPKVSLGPHGEWSFPECGPPAVDTPTGVAESPTVACGVASSGTAVTCSSGSPCEPVTPPPPPDLPSRADGERIALHALDVAGVDTSGSVTVTGPVGGWTVSTEPRVGGVRAYEWVTLLQIGSKGRVVSGYGQLGEPKALGDYPLVTAAKGFERLKAQPFPVPLRGGAERALAIAPGQPVPDSTTPVVRTIVRVSLGLQSVASAQDAFLVPVFLFETDDGGVVPVPAVIDALLEQPGGGPEPAPAPVPGKPGQVPPAPPADGGGGNSSSQACAGTSSAASANGGGNDNQPLTIEVCASPSHPKVGETVTFSLKASDPDAAMDADGCQQPTAGFGDEADQSVRCMSICSRESFPPEATAVGRTFTHAYAKPGTYTATFTADSCAPKASHGEATLQIVVRG
jgi:hypothetical protein